MAGLLGGLLFSGIGLIALNYGRRQGSIKAMGIGAALMVYPYFISNTGALYIVGAALVAALVIFRN